jgi:hypothetical protein
MYFVKEYARFEKLSRVDAGPNSPGGDDYLSEPESGSSLPPPTHNPGGDDEAPF